MEFARLLQPCCLVVAVWVLAAADLLVAQSPDNCTRTCGNNSVPYPFGLEPPPCSIHSGFHLSCNTTVDGATKLYSGTMEVIKISLQDSKIWLKTSVSRCCYDQTSVPVLVDVSNTPFVLSADDNKFIGLGCNGVAYMFSDGDAQTQSVTGCLSTCTVMSQKVNGSCSSTAGCCQTDLPRGVRSYNFTSSLNYNPNVACSKPPTSPTSDTIPCSYAVVMESAAFNFSTTYVTSSVFYDTDDANRSVVMDWAITNYTCQQAAQISQTTPYACRSHNSMCTMNNAGYVCNCARGYQGNPYILDGCEDIDECTGDPCIESGTCTNTIGNYFCSCPRGESMSNGACKKSSIGLSVGSGVGGGTSLLLLALGGPFIMRKIKQKKVKQLKQKFFNQNHGLLLKQLISHNTDIGERMIITLRELEKATDNFDSSRVVGGGGHGVVFKGILDLHVVAVKKSKIVVQREIYEFINEVAVLSQVNHRNVVKLLGCCLETEVPLLVYEFISNGTLYDHLHVEGLKSLIWVDRIRIVLEVARALSYLHSATTMPIFHRDIKSSNILLDDSLTTKVSDFGASRYIPIDQTGVTTIVQGTLGYLDPMYHYTGRLTDKSDVFSFGVLLIELLTRKKPFIYRSNGGDSLVSHFEKMHTKSNLAGIIDPQVMEEDNGDHLEVARLAVICTKLRGEDRPTMREVEMTLENLLVKKRIVPCIATPSRNDDVETQIMPIELVTNDLSRQYTMEEDILLSASHPR